MIQHSALPIRDLGCADAAPVIERVLRDVPGVTRVYVNPVTEMAYIEYDAERCGEVALRSALRRAGYNAAEPRRRL
ncbi:MAG: heavy metal-associated domain-containing protein [Gemmatimonadota bacterium]